MNILTIEDLHVQFSQKGECFDAVSGISLELEKGGILGIVGESGCGKTLSCLSIIGLLPRGAKISTGNIFLENMDILRLQGEEIRKLRGNRISMIFQEPMTALNPLLPVGEQISETARLHLKLSGKESRDKVIDMIEKVGLSRAKELYSEYPHQLSGGMRQRVMIAMALICSPELLIADEPTTALDVTVQAQILDLIREISYREGTSMIVISHNLGVIKELCSRVVIMYSGYILEEGKTEQVFKQPSHPYTKGLMESIPTPHKRGKSLYAIPGQVPSIFENREGCPFLSRCPYAVDRCKRQLPDMYEVHKGHLTRCFLVES